MRILTSGRHAPGLHCYVWFLLSAGLAETNRGDKQFLSRRDKFTELEILRVVNWPSPCP